MLGILLTLFIIGFHQIQGEFAPRSAFPEYVVPVESTQYASTFVYHNIEYRLSTNRATWTEANYVCKSMNSTLAVLDDYEKALFLAEALAESDQYLDTVWIGAKRDISKDPNNYYWITSRKSISRSSEKVWNARTGITGKSAYPLWINRTELAIPEMNADCVALQRGNHDNPVFLNLNCILRRGFVCEKRVTSRPKSEVYKVDQIECEGINYHVYNAESTWQQAVGYCSQMGMSIAMLDSVKCTEKIGARLMKLRPSIENVWIGGYGKGGEWSWLSTGELIQNSGRRDSNDVMEENWPPFRNHQPEKQDGCLLLDRHICNTTVFLEARCDRHRAFVCMDFANHESRGADVIIDEHFPNYHEDLNYYYIVPPEMLPYYESQDYCISINGTLGSVTDTHMYSQLMLTMGESLKNAIDHVWVSGQFDPSARQWKDYNTGYEIPGPLEGVLPWCENNDLSFAEEPTCLNLDRDSAMEGVLYGMPCSTPQNFICVVDKKIDLNYSQETPTSALFNSQVMFRSNTTLDQRTLKSMDNAGATEFHLENGTSDSMSDTKFTTTDATT